MIRDRIVVGLLDASLSMKLQMDPELMLEKAMTAARQTEAIKKQQGVVRGDQKLPLVDTVNSQKPKCEQCKSHSKNSSASPKQANKQACTRCGKTPSHGKQACPARDAICHKCAKKEHYQSMCRTKKAAVEQLEAETDDQFLGTLDVGTSVTSPWEVNLLLNGLLVLFKIDTRADVSAISWTTFKQLQGISLNLSQSLPKWCRPALFTSIWSVYSYINT